MQEHSSVRIEEIEDDDEVINLLKEFDQLLGNARKVNAHLEKHDISEGDPENIDENDVMRGSPWAPNVEHAVLGMTWPESADSRQEAPRSRAQRK